MKKLMILAALGTAALFTACGDDSSSSPSEGCDVTVNDNSVVVTTSLGGYSSTTTYTITEEGYTMKSEGDGYEPVETPVPTKVTIDDLKAMGDATCKAFEEAETVPAE
ncbi:MAG: hypothetical protein IKM81_03460 [Fibrobacter sp.]|nr:hypothetical protein [Fibrobacter sp.]